MLLIVRAYEQEASQYALAMFHRLAIRYLDQWLSDWVAGDWRYLQALYQTERYRTGSSPEVAPEIIGAFKGKYVVAGSALITPLPIPSFRGRVGESRNSF